jgi:hypothetical protein
MTDLTHIWYGWLTHIWYGMITIVAHIWYGMARIFGTAHGSFMLTFSFKDPLSRMPVENSRSLSDATHLKAKEQRRDEKEWQARLLTGCGGRIATDDIRH